MKKVTESFYFLRHGETDWNKKHLCQGSSDIPLNETGKQQALQAAKQLLKEPITRLISSPLLRAQETAQIISDVLNKPLTLEADLRECSFGIAEGKPIGTGKIFEDWIHEKTPEGGETRLEFETRVQKIFKHLLTSTTGPLLIVSHGGVLCTLQRFLG